VIIEVLVPKLGMGVEELELVKWYKKEGDRVEKGEPVVHMLRIKFCKISDYI